MGHPLVPRLAGRSEGGHNWTEGVPGPKEARLSLGGSQDVQSGALAASMTLAVFDRRPVMAQHVHQSLRAGFGSR